MMRKSFPGSRRCRHCGFDRHDAVDGSGAGLSVLHQGRWLRQSESAIAASIPYAAVSGGGLGPSSIATRIRIMPLRSRMIMSRRSRRPLARRSATRRTDLSFDLARPGRKLPGLFGGTKGRAEVLIGLGMAAVSATMRPASTNWLRFAASMAQGSSSWKRAGAASAWPLRCCGRQASPAASSMRAMCACSPGHGRRWRRPMRSMPPSSPPMRRSSRLRLRRRRVRRTSAFRLWPLACPR